MLMVVMGSAEVPLSVMLWVALLECRLLSVRTEELVTVPDSAGATNT
jgi:hypothetical protein